ncbi:nucleoporin SEH1 [Sporothrix schenckii 1099-18]|uniref:Nucleoporin SEH1 n=1 Tax=Sporothrix schenckii 1099-18 TaxID=1397361 RepID=A0A0F2MBZ5_SPOSC|nr:nucleoporin SEH1 [Sporothrix schenckii 1099-18]KJR87162.1 nucleoporin SEH1 [Sporothrix schenckii 1099-18]
MPAPQGEPPVLDDQARFEIIMKHGHQDLVQAVAFNAYGDRCATGSVDGKIRVFNRHRDGMWRLCDNWGAHGGEILDLQWLPPTIYPNLLASMGIEGRFKLWTEDPAAAPGRRFSQRAKGNAKAAFETRSPRSPYRSFSMKHNDETRHTYLALLAADGTLTVLENEVPENLSNYANVDELRVCPKPARGEEASFRVQFDPNPEPCFTALRAGVRADSLSLVVAAMDAVKIYRTRPITTTSYGLQGMGRAFYLAAEVKGHRGLVRDIAWAPGNFRGYDIIATACQDGYVRVVRLDTPFSANEDGKTWAAHDIVVKTGDGAGGGSNIVNARRKRDGKPGSSSGGLITAAAAASGSTTPAGPSSLSTPASVASSLSSTTRDLVPDAGASDETGGTLLDPHGNSSAISSTATSFSGLPPIPDASTHGGGIAAGDRHWTGEAGQVRHTVRELSKLENHRTPVWRVSFDDDGQILGSVGDDGKLLCYRQTPDGSWARSSELTVMKMRMAAP